MYYHLAIILSIFDTYVHVVLWLCSAHLPGAHKAIFDIGIRIRRSTHPVLAVQTVCCEGKAVAL